MASSMARSSGAKLAAETRAAAAATDTLAALACSSPEGGAALSKGRAKSEQMIEGTKRHAVEGGARRVVMISRSLNSLAQSSRDRHLPRKVIGRVGVQRGGEQRAARGGAESSFPPNENQVRFANE